MERNVKLYKWYIGLTYDFLFFLVVQVFFLNQVKNIDFGDILLLESIFAGIRLIIQIPLTKLTKKFGLLWSFRLGPIFTSAALVCFILAPSFEFLILAFVLKAIGWGFQNLSSSPLLYNELKHLNKEEQFGKNQGGAVSTFVFFNILSSTIAGILYDANPYLPIVICLIIHIIVIFISWIIKPSEIKETISKEESSKSVLKSIKGICQNKFFVYIFSFSMICWGIFGVVDTYNINFLTAIGLPVALCTFLLAITEVVSFIFSKYQYKTDKLFKGNALIVLAIAVTVPFIIIGLGYSLKLPFIVLAVGMMIAIFFERLASSQFRIYSLNYVNKYSEPGLQTETLGAYYLFEPLGRVIITFVGSIIIKYNNVGLSYIILIGLFIVPLLYVSIKLTKYLKTYN